MTATAPASRFEEMCRIRWTRITILPNETTEYSFYECRLPARNAEWKISEIAEWDENHHFLTSDDLPAYNINITAHYYQQRKAN